LTSEHNPAEGLACAKIINTKKIKLPKDQVGSLHQRLKAKNYLNRKVRFTAFVKAGELLEDGVTRQEGSEFDYLFTEPPHIFINAKSKSGLNIASGISEYVVKRG
jgi:hypothetical protein